MKKIFSLCCDVNFDGGEAKKTQVLISNLPQHRLNIFDVVDRTYIHLPYKQLYTTDSKYIKGI